MVGECVCRESEKMKRLYTIGDSSCSACSSTASYNSEAGEDRREEEGERGGDERRGGGEREERREREGGQEERRRERQERRER